MTGTDSPAQGPATSPVARRYPRVATLTTHEAFRDRLAELGLALPSVLARPPVPTAAPLIVTDTAGTRLVGNRWCALPMEGWDGNPDGSPTALMHRRWRRFGGSGAKLIWGGEAAAVRPDGRANPHQLMLTADTVDGVAALRQTLVDEHAARFGRTDDLVVGLQLTHAGRYARPDGTARPMTAYPHPLLDRRVGSGRAEVVTDDFLDELVEDFAGAAALAAAAGFDFVDVKHCHGYLGHELLSGLDRPGRYGGDFTGRTAFLRRTVARIRETAPGMLIGVRLSAFDFIPFHADDSGVGQPASYTGTYRYAFGGDGTGTGIDLRGPDEFLSLCESLGVGLVCLTAGSPYYVPHIQRPAYFPPSDGYAPPEDPLVGVARMLGATRELKRRHPGLTVVASGLSYLQEWAAAVADGLVAEGWADSVGLGRMMLSAPTLPADSLAGRAVGRKVVCRTFSDCTTSARHGLVSGCYPLDPDYRSRPEKAALDLAKRAARASS